MSLLTHGVILSEFSYFSKNIPKKKISVKEKKNVKEIVMIPGKIEKIAKKRIKALNEPKPVPYTENMLSKLIGKDNFSRPKEPQAFEKNIKEIIFSEAPSLDRNLSKNSTYMSYYRLIRERIRNNAYQNYSSNKKGEVLVTFLIFSNGALKDINFNTSSVKNKVLKDITLKSIKESAPFPAFPEQLKKYSQLRFNVSIYFKNN